MMNNPFDTNTPFAGAEKATELITNRTPLTPSLDGSAEIRKLAAGYRAVASALATVVPMTLRGIGTGRRTGITTICWATLQSCRAIKTVRFPVRFSDSVRHVTMLGVPITSGAVNAICPNYRQHACVSLPNPTLW